MKIHHLRNATFVIESGSRHIIVDPMLGDKGCLPCFAWIKHKPARNPIVDLPAGSDAILEKVNFCLSTHSQKWGFEPLTHSDHLDPAGRTFLQTRQIPVACLSKDAGYMEKNGIPVAARLDVWQPRDILGGRITAIPAQHGHSWVHHIMANGAGFFLELPDEPSIYISGDTVLTDDVCRALTRLKPDIAVVAAGSAGMDVGGHILMSLEEIIEFTRAAPAKVLANHMDALNHCPTTRDGLRQELDRHGLLSKVMIPADGETLTLDLPA